MRGLVSTLVVLVGCGSPSDNDGEVGGACYPNATCNVGLVCVEGICRPADAGVDAPADPSHISLAIDRRPTVVGISAVTVHIGASGINASHMFAVGQLPATVDVPRPASGPATLSVDAFNASSDVVGVAATVVAASASTASVVLDPTDFVVNSVYVGDQFLTTDYEAAGLQLAAINNGQWMAAFRDDCATNTSSCNIYGRRFDSNGSPVVSQLAGGDSQFTVSTTPTTAAAMPALASSGLTTLAFWDFTESGNRGVACRAIDQNGAAAGNQVTISSDAADVVVAAGLANGNLAVAWQLFMSPTYVTRMAVVGANCAVVSGPTTLSATTGTFGANRPHVSANGQTILFSWLVDDELWIRTSTLAGVLSTERKLLAKTAAQTIEHVRIAPWNDGFAVVVRWASTQSDALGKIEVVRVSAAGVVQGTSVVITDQSRSDFASNKSFGVATRASDGALVVAWHVCDVAGECNVFGRVLHPTGVPVGDTFALSTTTQGEQITPSIAALADSFIASWNDASGKLPDNAGLAVRARLLYPDVAATGSRIGHVCVPGPSACDAGLVCAPGSDGVNRCFEECQTACPRGGTCTAVGTSSACIF